MYQVPFNAVAGVDLLSKALPNGGMIRGIQIDNPTGSWLYIVSERAYCPPYTVGWAMPLTYGQSAITITAGNGPSGQIGTDVGDPWTLYLFDEEVESSAGVPYQFVQNYSPTLLAGQTFTIPTGSALINQNLVSAVVGRQLRIISAAMSYNDFGNFITPQDSSVVCALFSRTTGGISGGMTIGHLNIGPTHPDDVRIFDPSLRLPIDQGFHIAFAQAAFAATDVIIRVQYEVT